MTTIPGGRKETTAANILAEIGPNMDRFKRRSFVRLGRDLSGNNRSAGKSKAAGSKKANKFLLTALVEGAWAAGRKQGSMFNGSFTDGSTSWAEESQHRDGPEPTSVGMDNVKKRPAVRGARRRIDEDQGEERTKFATMPTNSANSVLMRKTIRHWLRNMLEAPPALTGTSPPRSLRLTPPPPRAKHRRRMPPKMQGGHSPRRPPRAGVLGFRIRTAHENIRLSKRPRTTIYCDDTKQL
ncbi:MAG: transposase [Bryobacterales bacterium]|nr:transposase [Bryobacterales bacterium]